MTDSCAQTKDGGGLVVHEDNAGHGGAGLRAGFPHHARGTHAAMLWAWLMLNGRVSLDRKEELSAQIRKLRCQSVMPIAAFEEVEAGELHSADLDEDGNDFVAYYYGTYRDDFDEAAGLVETSDERLPDTWESYKRIAAVINRSYGQWIGNGRPASLEDTNQSASKPRSHTKAIIAIAVAAVVVLGLILILV